MSLHFNKFMAASSLNQSDKIKVIKWIFFGLSVALTLFLIINGAISGDNSAAESNFFAKIFANIINAFKSDTINDSNFESFASVLRKLLGHFLAFSVDGVFVSLTCFYFLREKEWSKWFYPIIISFGVGLFVAGLSEFLQVFTADRYGSFIDIGIDMGGYVLGMFVVFLIQFFTHKLIVNQKNTEN